MDAMNSNAPCWFSARSGVAAWARFTLPQKFKRKRRSHSSLSSCHPPLPLPEPKLATTTSRRRHRPCVLRRACSIMIESVRSPQKEMTHSLPNSASNSARALDNGASLRPVIHTRQPSRRKAAAFALPIPREEPATSATRFCRERFKSSIVPIAANKCEVLFCPGHFISRGSARDLQGEISSVLNLFEAGEERRKVRIAGSQRNGPTVQHPVLNVDAADSVPVSCELVGCRISQRSAVPRIVIHF